MLALKSWGCTCCGAMMVKFRLVYKSFSGIWLVTLFIYFLVSLFDLVVISCAILVQMIWCYVKFWSGVELFRQLVLDGFWATYVNCLCVNRVYRVRDTCLLLEEAVVNVVFLRYKFFEIFSEIWLVTLLELLRNQMALVGCVWLACLKFQLPHCRVFANYPVNYEFMSWFGHRL